MLSKWLADVGDGGIAVGDYRDVVVFHEEIWRFRKRDVLIRYKPAGWPPATGSRTPLSR